MEPFTPLRRRSPPRSPAANVDTDQIIPARFLQAGPRRDGYGRHALPRPALRRRGQRRGRTSCSTSRRIGKRRDPGRRAEFRLRLVARAGGLGAARLRHPLRDRAELRRHLLRQLLQERRAADPLPPTTWRRRCAASSRRSPEPRSRSTSKPDLLGPGRHGVPIRDELVPQGPSHAGPRRVRHDPGHGRRDRAVRGGASANQRPGLSRGKRLHARSGDYPGASPPRAAVSRIRRFRRRAKSAILPARMEYGVSK